MIPPRLLRIKEVMHRVGISRATVYLWIRNGTFPKPIQMSPNAVAWVETDIDDWIAEKIRVARGNEVSETPVAVLGMKVDDGDVVKATADKH